MTNARLVQEFEARFRELAAQGRPPDALRQRSPIESERFWARTVPGPDGHTYWTGGRVFTRNDGSTIRPARWVWTQTRGPVSRRAMVFPTCGESRCVTLDHLDHDVDPRHAYSDEALIGAGQVATMRRGRPPSLKWWEANIKRPNRKTIIRRFGSWARFLAAIGHPKGKP